MFIVAVVNYNIIFVQCLVIVTLIYTLLGNVFGFFSFEMSYSNKNVWQSQAKKKQKKQKNKIVLNFTRV